jgi:hypothetical protein
MCRGDAQDFTPRAQVLDARIEGVRNPYGAVAGHADRMRTQEIAGSRPLMAQGAHETPTWRQYLNTIISLIGYIEQAVWPEGKAERRDVLSPAPSTRPKRGEEMPREIEV